MILLEYQNIKRWRNCWNILWKLIVNQKEFRTQTIIKLKCDKLYVKWEGYSNSFNCWIDKKDSLISEYFPESKSLGKVEVELGLSNYATKTDLKNATGTNKSSFAEKTDSVIETLM